MRVSRALSVVCACWSLSAAAGALRPPSVPLVSIDPFFSVWSPADRLTDAPTVHWSEQAQPMTAMVRVDGKAYRLLGAEPAGVPALPQTACDVAPLRTVCRFADAAVEVELTFSTPLMPENLDVFSRPVSYVALRIASRDGSAHSVQTYYDVGGEIAVGDDAQTVVWQPETATGLAAARLGRDQQPVLGKSGDRVRIDWGWFWLAAPDAGATVRGVAGVAARQTFAAQGTLAEAAAQTPVAVNAGRPALAYARDFGSVRTAETHLLLAYDDVDAVQFFNRPLKAWWRRNGLPFAAMLAAAEQEYPELSKRMAAFDAELTADLLRVGGEKYAALAALAYRQSFAACKLVADPNGQPLYFSKENASNGCMGTVDVLYPQIPHLLLMSPALVRATLAPILLYASDPRWRFDFAPHDIGQYPLGNGQRYGEGERGEKNQMPVEECGNMLISLGALSQIENSAAFAAQWWPTVTRWAEYLSRKGFDPENQLCTDDFAGHLAHNANLSIKAIMGLACYAKMAALSGDAATAERFMQQAKAMVPKWMDAAKGGRGGSYRLAFDQPDTWSMKYNLVWDRALGFNLFPPEVAATEMAFYRTAQQAYGLPLDSRKLWTKSDWLVWTATLTGKRDDFEALVAPLSAFLNATPGRIPFGDWYETDSAKFLHFRGRSVVGGVFMPCLYDAALWKKYAARDTFKTGLYAPLGPKPETARGMALVPEGRLSKEIRWRYTTQPPAEGWQKPGFDDSAWQTGPGGFGQGAPGGTFGTPWNTPRLWVRRAFELTQPLPAELTLSIYHDEDSTVYLNGVEAAHLSGFSTDYVAAPVAEAACAALVPGRNVLAANVSQTTGGQYFDAGLTVPQPPLTFRMATFNIRCPIDKGVNAWSARVPRVRQLIREHGFELIGLQEATSNQIDDLLMEGWSFVGVGRDDGKRGGEASCIFYKKDRFEVRASGTFWLSETPEIPGSKSWNTTCTRICTWARLADLKTGREFFYFNTHLDHKSEEARTNGIALILSRMAQLAQGRPVLLSGDFNAEPGSEPVKRAASVLRDSEAVSRTPHAGPEKTFNGFRLQTEPNARIDYIFVSAGVRVLSHATLNDRFGGLFASDHFPVASDVALE